MSRNRDIRVGARLILCACELDSTLELFGDFDDWEPGKDVDRDTLAKEVIESAFSVRDQIRELNDQGLA